MIPLLIQLAYIFTIMIGVISFSMQYMIVGKNLCVTNPIIKSRNATIFLVLILGFNICDFLLIFLGAQLGNESVEWIFVIENVLEVCLAYSIIATEAEYAGAKIKNWLHVFFIFMSVIILWVDTMYVTETLNMSEDMYVAVMIILNFIPLIVTTFFCIIYIRIIAQSTDGRISKIYLIIYNSVFLFLCVVVTISILDSRTTWNYVKNDRELHAIFWLIFNSLNAAMIWLSCKANKLTESETVESKIARLSQAKGLSDREREIAMLIYEGKNNNQIAETLYLSLNTVKVHTSNLYRKLGVTNRLQAVRMIRDEDEVLR